MPSDHLPLAGVFKIPISPIATFREGQPVRAKAWTNGTVVDTDIDKGTVDVKFDDRRLGIQSINVKEVNHDRNKNKRSRSSPSASPKSLVDKQTQNKDQAETDAPGEEKLVLVPMESDIPNEIVEDELENLLIHCCIHEFYLKSKSILHADVTLNTLASDARVIKLLQEQVAKAKNELLKEVEYTFMVANLHSNIDYSCNLSNSKLVAYSLLKDFRNQHGEVCTERVSYTRPYMRLCSCCERARKQFLDGETSFTIEIDALVGTTDFCKTLTFAHFDPSQIMIN